MLSRSFKIVAPKRFELYVEDIEDVSNQAIIKIDKAAICKADIRYYLGNRSERVLGLKYPMNLIHEAVGTVLHDPTKTFKEGERVTLVPNLTINCDKENCRYKACKSQQLGENYCPHALFASSNYNGFSREMLSYPVTNLVSIPEEIESSTAVFSELISVANAAIRRIKISGDETIAVWGDGILGYILTSTLRTFHQGKIIIVGKNRDKLERFPADKYFVINDERIAEEEIDIAFECVGGLASQSAIGELIQKVVPGGKLVLTGVSEKPIEIDTRKILEKGLELYGVTRSNISDFRRAVEDLKDENFRDRISKLVLEERNIRNINDFYDAFEYETQNRKLGKIVMNFML